MDSIKQIADDLVDFISKTLDEIPDSLGKRIVKNRIMKEFGPPPQKPPTPIEPFTDVEAKRYGETFMKFGKHTGTRIDEVDIDYLQWLADASRDTWRDIHRYLNSPRILKENGE